MSSMRFTLIRFIANYAKLSTLEKVKHRFLVNEVFRVKLKEIKNIYGKDVKLSTRSVCPRLLLLWTLPFLSLSSETESGSGLNPAQIGLKKDVRSAIKEADELSESNKYQEAITVLLPHKNSGDVEVLWRLCRAQYNLSQSDTVSVEQRAQLIGDAYAVVSEALLLDDSHWAAHKWMSVLLDARSTYDGIKARISQVERVKYHMLRAAELNPKDAMTLYMLGTWCYEIAAMPWIQRKIAAAIFAAPPYSSFEEALHYFSKAEQVEPKFYSKNLLMLGKTLVKLQRQAEAAHYFRMARDYPSTSEEDNIVRKEAAQLLKSMKVTDETRS